MTVYLAFLRAINLGSRHVFPKDDIRRVVEACGFDDVATHINTGNVRFSTTKRCGCLRRNCSGRSISSVASTQTSGMRQQIARIGMCAECTYTYSELAKEVPR